LDSGNQYSTNFSIFNICPKQRKQKRGKVQKDFFPSTKKKEINID